MTGSVYWITGLSGAGKTTISQLLAQSLRLHDNQVILLDGDTLREVLNSEDSYDSENRQRLALTYSRLCKLLSSQSFSVVIATISMFHDVRRWNRLNLPNYTEIYLRVPMSTLIKRDQKQLYSRYLSGQASEVMGLDVPFEEPIDPDIIIDNDDNTDAHEALEKILRHIESSSDL